MALALSVDNVTKMIGARTLFKELSFGLDERSRVGLVGPNGSGKSTLLKCLSGLDHFDQGRAVWGRGRKVEYVSQSPIALAHWSIEDFLFEGAPDHSEMMGRLWTALAEMHWSLDRLERPFSDLSGGAQKKCQILKALLREPQFLLMDEPTNHLDLESIEWLEEFLSSQVEIGLLVVSHDRLFLENVVNEVIELDSRHRGGHLRVVGTFSQYLDVKAEVERSQLVEQQRKANTLRRETEWLRRGAQARQTKQKARQQAAGELKSEVEILKAMNRRRQIDLDLQTSGRGPKKLIECKGLTVSRSSQVLVESWDFIVHQRTRMGLLGRNGAGKSSLIQALIKEAPEGLDIQGTLRRAEGLTVSYFQQQRDGLDPEQTLLQQVCPDGDYVMVRGQAVYGRSYLDRFGFRRDQYDLKVRELSGGEQNRLMLARLMMSDSQMIVLDEPTNDLDFETLASLRQSLEDFDGAVILVSHDRAFMDEVCTELVYFPTVDESEILGDQKLIKFSSFLQWQSWRSELAEKRSQRMDQNRGSEQGASAKKASKLSYKEQKEFEQIEGLIATAEMRLDGVMTELGKREVQSNASELVRLTQEAQDIEQQIADLFSRWQDYENRKSDRR